MLHIDDIYEIDKARYKDYVYRTHTDSYEMHKEEDDNFILVYATSKKNGEILFAREADKEKITDKFFLVNSPLPIDMDPPIAYQQVVLETPEQVQAYLRGMAQMQKESES